MAELKNPFIFVVRLVSVGATLGATIVMATSHETTNIFGLSFEAKYSDTPAFKYFVIANAIASVYGFLVPFLPSKSSLLRLVVVSDLVMTMLLTSSISAALAIGEVGKHGNTHAGWPPICGQVPKYCEHVKGALIAGFIAIIIYMLIILHSIRTLLMPLFHKS